MNLTEQQVERYSRQIILRDVGGTGQEKLLRAKVLIIGAGGLGAPAALYLAAAGIGTLGLVDGDAVELSNLQRQIIHSTPDVGRPKVVSAAEKIKAINPEVRAVLYEERATAATIRQIIRDEDYDFIIDGTDNFPAKFLINDACVFEGKPFSHGGILRFDGQTMTHVPGRACYRCVFAAPPPAGAVPSCSQAGVLGAVAGILGTIQAAEAVKSVLGLDGLLTDRMLTFNAARMEFRTIRLKRNPGCPLCGKNPSITVLEDQAQPICDLAGRGKE